MMCTASGRGEGGALAPFQKQGERLLASPRGQKGGRIRESHLFGGHDDFLGCVDRRRWNADMVPPPVELPDLVLPRHTMLRGNELLALT